MPFTLHEVGGIAVAFSDSEAKDIDRALQRLDRGLFLDKEYEPHGPHGGYVYYVVKHNIGSGHPPIPCVEWRDTNGPFPLSMALVEKVRHQEGRMDGAVKWAVEHNEKKKAGVTKDIRDAQDGILKDHIRMSKSKHYSVWNRNDLKAS